MIGIVLVSHSAEIAAGLARLAAQMAGPDVRIVPAGGLETPGALGTDAARVARAIEDAWSDDGVLVLMDLGSALLSTEFALDLLDEERRGKVLLTAAPLVEGAVAAAVTAGLGDPLEACAEAARHGLEAKAAQLGEERGGESGAGAVVAGATGPADAPAAHTAAASGCGETATGSSASPADEGAAQAPAAAVRVKVTPALGLHARPAALLVRTAGRFDAQVTVADLTNARGPVSARSLTAVSLLGAEHGDELLVTAAGPQASEALQAVRRLADDSFGEPPAAKPAPADGADIGPAEPAGARAAAPRAGTVLHGIATSPGVAAGPARRLCAAATAAAVRGPASEPQAEWDALGAALAGAAGEIAATRERVAAAARPHDAAIFDAHLLFLEDEGLLEAARTGIFRRRLSASQAWADAVATAAAQWDGLRDSYQRERAGDLRAVGDQVLALLVEPEGEAVASGPDGGAAGRAAADGADGVAGGDAPVAETADEAPSEPAVLVARDLSPAQVAAIDTAQVAAIACSAGGPASHAAILARAFGIPAVVGAGPALLEVPEGTVLQVDGDAGTVTVEPDASARAGARQRRRARAAALAAARAVAAEPAVTRDGVTVPVEANIGSVREAQDAVAAGADGVGLLRTEFLFMAAADLPGEDDQAKVYAAVADALDGRPLTVRTLDAGADKPLPAVHLEPEDNPFLGVRGLRLGLAHPGMLLDQLRAVLRVAARAPLRVMFPMVSTVTELRRALALVHEARESLRARGVAVPDRLETGIMLEVPAAALSAVTLAPLTGFFSVGTNDLTQYTLAAERGNAGVTELYDPLHPAVLRLIKLTADAAAPAGRRVAVCGEVAADPAAVPLLLGLGVTELSVSPAAVALVKQAVRATPLDTARRLADEALEAESGEAVRRLLA